MSAKNHTPGPWRVPKGGLHILDTVGEHLAVVVEHGVGSMTADANADLIAAAPELLAALTLVTTKSPDVFSWLPASEAEFVRQAMKKAIGEE